jgi:DNA-binding MarR family transcriptional regulator
MKEVINKPQGMKFDDDDFALVGLFIQTRDVFYRARAKELGKYNLTPMDSITLAYINYLKDRATPAELSRCIYKRHHTIIGQLKRMKKKGLLTMTKGHIQKNIITIKLTNKGNEALKQVMVAQSVHNVISSLTEGERKQLGRTLLKLRGAAIKEIGENDDSYFPMPLI